MTGLRIKAQPYPVADQASKKKPSNIRVIVVESTIFPLPHTPIPSVSAAHADGIGNPSALGLLFINVKNRTCSSLTHIPHQF